MWKAPVVGGISVPDWFCSVCLIRPLVWFFSVVSIPLLKCSYEAVAVILPEICFSSRMGNKCNFL